MTDTTRAILFPGQGAQAVGMGLEFAKQYGEARALFERADDVLGFSLSSLCFEGPADALEKTDHCQPGILVTSLAIAEVLRVKFGMGPENFRLAAGLSLGEYTAYCFAGALSFEDAVKLVRLRGLWMQGASDATPSGMIALVGASREQAKALVERASDAGVIVAANFLAPGQIVLSGDNAAIERAEGEAKELGVRRCVRLKVAGAFHSPIMSSAAERLAAELDNVSWLPPKIPVVSNVTGAETRDPEVIRDLLKRQVTSPVYWEESMLKMDSLGVDTFLEPGPGKVLCGLARKVLSGKKALSVDSPDDLSGLDGVFSGGTSLGDGSTSAELNS